jgi:hypothetical protein
MAWFDPALFQDDASELPRSGAVVVVVVVVVIIIILIIRMK